MDPNNANQDQSQQTTPPPSDTAGDVVNAQEVTQNQPATDTQDTTTPPEQQSDPSIAAEPQSAQTDTASQPASDQTQSTQQTDQAPQDTAAAAQPAGGNYIEDVGEDLIDLLDEIEADDNLVEVVANEMRLDKERVKTTLSKLLDKIDEGQVTAEELALIMAAPVVDELPEDQTPADQAQTNQPSEPQQ